MAKPGPKPSPIDPSEVRKLAEIGVKIEEMAHVFGVSRDTLERRFRKEINEGRQNLKNSLRVWQLSAARKGNVTMQIWLGKQLLDQCDQPTNDEEHEDYKRPESMRRSG